MEVKRQRPLRTAIFVLVIIMTAVLLAGCDFFFQSPFPSYIVQAVNFLDLSVEIGEGNFEYALNVLHNGSSEYIFLFVGDPSSAANTRLFVLNTDLEVAAARTNQDFGRAAAVDAVGDFVIGDVRLNGSDFSITGLAGIGYDYEAVPVAGTSTNYVLENVYPEPVQLQFTDYDSTWLVGASISTPVSSAGDIELKNAYYDALNDDICMFFAANYDDSPVYALVTDETAFPPAANPILSDPASVSFSEVRFDRDYMFYTHDGFILIGHNDKLKYFASDGTLISELPSQNKEGVRMTFSITGDYYYVFEEYSNRIYKCETWW